MENKTRTTEEKRKVVINDCYGGFRLSPKASKRYLELKGLPCYFFTYDNIHNTEYIPITLEETEENWLLMTIFTVPNPSKVLPENHQDSDGTFTTYNQKYDEIAFLDRKLDRDDPILIQVVEELGAEASGRYAKLKIVEIPKDVQYTIEEYDGNEHIAEVHRTWS